MSDYERECGQVKSLIDALDKSIKLDQEDVRWRAGVDHKLEAIGSLVAKLDREAFGDNENGIKKRMLEQAMHIMKLQADNENNCRCTDKVALEVEALKKVSNEQIKLSLDNKRALDVIRFWVKNAALALLMGAGAAIWTIFTNKG